MSLGDPTLDSLLWQFGLQVVRIDWQGSGWRVDGCPCLVVTCNPTHAGQEPTPGPQLHQQSGPKPPLGAGAAIAPGSPNAALGAPCCCCGHQGLPGPLGPPLSPAIPTCSPGREAPAVPQEGLWKCPQAGNPLTPELQPPLWGFPAEEVTLSPPPDPGPSPKPNVHPEPQCLRQLMLLYPVAAPSLGIPGLSVPT